MFNVKNLQKYGAPKLPKLFYFYLALLTLIFPSAVLAAEHPCVNATMQLRGDLGVVINRGGLWSLMEQRGLKENSVMGMQVDGKLARLVGLFEELCESEKKPEKQLFTKISNILGEARVIFNPRSSGKKLLELITKLGKNLDTLLSKVE